MGLFERGGGINLLIGWQLCIMQLWLMILVLHLANYFSHILKRRYSSSCFCHAHRNTPELVWISYTSRPRALENRVSGFQVVWYDIHIGWLLKLLELLVIEASRSFSGKNIFPIFLFRFLTSLVGLVVYMTSCSFVCCPRQEFFSFVTASWIWLILKLAMNNPLFPLGYGRRLGVSILCMAWE